MHSQLFENTDIYILSDVILSESTLASNASDEASSEIAFAIANTALAISAVLSLYNSAEFCNWLFFFSFFFFFDDAFPVTKKLISTTVVFHCC